MAVHLYGATTGELNEPLTGRQDRDVRLVSDDGLAVIVSDVDEAARVGRQDLLSHAHVLEWFADRAAVIPMRFGIVVPDDDAAREQVLRRDRAELEQLFSTFDGTVQVSVHAFQLEEPALREVMRRNPALVAARDQLQALPEAAARPGQIELGRAIAEELEELQRRDRALLIDRLAPLAKAVAESDPAGALEVANVALLVEQGDRSRMDEAVGALREELAGWIRLRYVGPQPPYSFLKAAQNGSLAWV